MVSNRPLVFHGKKDWRIEFWKGDYGPTIGAEVGLYYKDAGTNSQWYECVSNEDCLNMFMKLNDNAGNQLFERSPVTTWWLTGFQIHAEDIDPSDLVLQVMINFKDHEMLNEFEYALNGLDDSRLSFSEITDHSAYVEWR